MLIHETFSKTVTSGVDVTTIYLGIKNRLFRDECPRDEWRPSLWPTSRDKRPRDERLRDQSHKAEVLKRCLTKIKILNILCLTDLSGHLSYVKCNTCLSHLIAAFHFGRFVRIVWTDLEWKGELSTAVEALIGSYEQLETQQIIC